MWYFLQDMFLEAVQLQNIFILFEGSVFWNFCCCM